MRPRERRFVAEYLRSADAPRAARAAGYAPSRASFHSLRLLAKAEVRAAVQRGRQDRAERTGLTLERVLLEYARLALADLGRVLALDADGVEVRPLLDLPPDDSSAIASVTFAKGGGVMSVALHEKSAALEALALYFNVFDPEAWRDASEGARDRLLARLAAMDAAEAAPAAREALPRGEETL